MRRKFKRTLAGMLAILTVATTVGTGVSDVSAASSSSNLKLWYASTKEHGVVTEFNTYTYTGNIMYAMLDGETAYCLNYAKSADGGQTMKSSSEPKTDLSETQEKQLAYCLYYGFGTTEEESPSNTQRNQFIGTQAMVWIIEKDLFGTSKADSAAEKLCKCAPSSSAAYEYYETLRDKMKATMNVTIPSFASTTQSSAKTYELEWNESKQRFETTLTDSNGALSNFNFVASGYSTEVNGNKITIYTKNVSNTTTTITGTEKNGAVTPKTGVVYWTVSNSKYQEFISSKPQADPVYAYFKVKTESIGYGILMKYDEETNTPLKGAVYGIYADSSCTKLVDELTTGSDGSATTKELTAGTYYVKERVAPEGYVLSTKVHTVTITPGQTTTFTVIDKAQMGVITIYKKGEVLTGWNGSNFTYEEKYLAGATFKVTAGSDIYKADGKKVHSKGDVIAEALTTGSDGKALLTDLYLGTYVVIETESIDGYTINTDSHTVKIEYEDQTATVQYESATVKNERQTAEVSVKKTDSDTDNPLSGGQYTLYAGNDITDYQGNVIVTKGTALQTVTTKNGTASYTVDLPIANSYYIKETLAPENYVRNSEDVYSFTFNYLDETKASANFSYTFENDRTTAKIAINKVDAETNKAVAQGDASLKGAVYGLYAREDIAHPDGASGIVFKADELVATLTTDANGKASVSGLYLGKYYVKEISPPEGYLLDETEYDVTCSYEGDSVTEVSRSTTVKEQVVKQAFQLIKISDDGSNTEGMLLEHAGFTAYLKSDLSVKEDGSYDFDSATPVVIGANGETELFTDETGYLVTIPLAYGTYVVVESTTPHNMETIAPFEVTVSKNSPDVPQIWRVFLDREFSAKLRIVKKDADTGKTVLEPNAQFKIYDLEKDEYVSMITTYPSKVVHTSFLTDEDGDLILPEALAVGSYRVEEVAAPYNYVLNEEAIIVEVDTNTFYEVDPETNEAIITIECVDEPVVGELTIRKEGEVLTGMKGLLPRAEGKDFLYKETGLSGAKFEVYAAEDIYTADKQTDVNGDRIKYYSKDELVATVTTSADGTATVKDLPLGSYRVVEVEAPYGFVLNTNEIIATLEYADDRTPVVSEQVTFINDRQKVSLSLVKYDAETAETLAGAEFGLYAAEDIVNVYGKVIVSKDTLLERATSDENGEITFTKDYPLGSYYAKELTPPAGYATSDEVVTINAEYQGQDIIISKYEIPVLNEPTVFEFTKTDITSGAELSGATLTVLDKYGNVVDRWVSDANEAHVIKRLVAGETYTLREELAPYGYLRATDVKFTVEDTNEIQSVEMKDEVPTGTIIISKDGEFVTDISLVKDHWYDFIFNFFRDSLAGVTFEVYAAEDIMSADDLGRVYYEKDALVATIVTDEKGFAVVEDLPLGKYYVKETAAIDGFVLDETPMEADLSYIDQETEVIYAGMCLTNERQKVEIHVTKTASDTGEVLQGAIFGLYAAEDIVNSDGVVIVTKDTFIEMGITDESGYYSFESDLPLGKYYLAEMEAPAGFVKSGEIYEIDATYQGADVPVITFEAAFTNDSTKLEISKTDITGENELAGATLSIIDQAGNVIDTWVSDGTTHYIERIPVGHYILREEISPYGYKIANDVEFDIIETAEIQKVTMKDDLVKGKIIIKKTDSVNSRAIAGVEFAIFDSEANLVETIITDKNGYAESSLLDIATFENGAYKEDLIYYVAEVKAANGYILDDTIHEVVMTYEEDAPEELVYTLELTNVPEDTTSPTTGDKSYPVAVNVVCIAAIAAAVGALIYNRKKNK